MKKLLLSLVLLVLSVTVAFSCTVNDPDPKPVVTDYQAIVNRAVEENLITYAQGDSKNSVTKKLTLATSVSVDEYSVAVTWASNTPAVIDVTGKVSADLEEDKSVTLTATAALEGKTAIKATVLSVPHLVYSLSLEGAIVYLNGNTSDYVTQNVVLKGSVKVTGTNDYAAITWTTSNSDVVNVYGTVHRPVGDPVEVTLNASASYGTKSVSETYVLTVIGTPADPWVEAYASLNTIMVGYGVDTEDFIPRLTSASAIQVSTQYWAAYEIIRVFVTAGTPATDIATWTTLFNNEPDLVYAGVNPSIFSDVPPLDTWVANYEGFGVWLQIFANGQRTELDLFIDENFYVTPVAGWEEVFEELEIRLGVDLTEILPTYNEEVFVDVNYPDDAYVDIVVEETEGAVDAYAALLLEAGYVQYGTIQGNPIFVWDFEDGTGLFVVPYIYHGYLELYVYIDEYNNETPFNPWVGAYATLDSLFSQIWEDSREYIAELEGATEVEVDTTYAAGGLVSIYIAIEDAEGSLEAYLALYDENELLTYIGELSGVWVGMEELVPTWVVNFGEFGVYFQIYVYEDSIEIDIFLDEAYVEEIPTEKHNTSLVATYTEE
jgi:hypothetical protein